MSLGMASRRHVFSEVFPSFTNTTTPTPTATPVLDSSPFVGSSSFSEGFAPGNQESAAAETIRGERAWHNVTAFLSLPDQPVTADGNHSAKGKWAKPYTQEVSASIIHLLSAGPQRTQSKAADHQDDIIDWYAHEVGKHFVDVQLSVILKVWPVFLGKYEDKTNSRIATKFYHPFNSSYRYTQIPPGACSISYPQGRALHPCHSAIYVFKST